MDDFSHVHGAHTFRIGFSWLHDTVTDLDFQALAGPINGSVTTTLGRLLLGWWTEHLAVSGLPVIVRASIRMNTFGGYIADEWRVNQHLSVSLNLRMENYGSPTCDSNCFSKLNSAFTGASNPGAAAAPYNQIILSGQHDAYSHTQALVWEPRAGIAWKPFKGDTTVVRAGGGIFADQLPGGLAEEAAFNAPGLNSFTHRKR
ncbi:MAG: hypothetical protein WDO73_00170 [Ignavibacteriota bacterium]